MAGSGLKTLRCRVRISGRTVTFECLAPTAGAAGYVIARQAFDDRDVLWVQVVVSEWSGVLGEFIEPKNAIVFTRNDPVPDGADHVVLIGVVSIDDR